MQSLRDILTEAEENKRAIGHFNAATLEMAHGIFDAARKAEVPVVIGFSEGERDFFGVHEAPAIIKTLREQYGYPIYANADHTYSVERVKEAIDAGFDAVIFDGAQLSFEENVEKTKECVAYAQSKDTDVLVEAELGYIGTSSKVWDEAPEGASIDESKFTDPESARKFVQETGVDLLAPAVGNLHGMSKEGRNPEIDTERVTNIREAAGIPLVLHGGSGISDENFREGIKAGIAHIHVSTEIRVAVRKAIEDSLKEDPDEIAPYRYLKPAREAAERIVSQKLALFTNP